MSLFVDTSVWSLALRRDTPPDLPEVQRLAHALESGELVFLTGVVLQELLQGFAGPRNREKLVDRLAPLPYLVPERADHIEAAELRNLCRRSGIQIGTIDALLARICIRHGLTMLTTDGDFRAVASLCPLSLWTHG